MNALLSFIEKVLIGIFILGFGTLLVVGLIRYNSGGSEEIGSWRHIKSQNTIEAYLDFLRDCQSCPHEEEAENALDELQRPRGLVARLDRKHLAARASIGLPVFSPDGRTVLAVGGAGPDFWDANTGAHLARGENAFATGGRVVEALAYSPDGRRIAAGMSGAEGGNMLAWDARSGERVGDHIVEGYDVKTVAFAPQGTLVGWLAQGPVGIWEPATGKFLRATHEGAGALAFYRAENGPVWMLTAAGRELWFWNPLSMELARQAEIHSERALLGLSQDGRLIAYYNGPILELWDTRTATSIATLPELDGDILAFCREPRKGWVAIGTKAGTLYLWDPAVPTALARMPAHKGPIEQLACSTQGRAATTSWDGAKVWDLEKLRKGEPRPPRG
jgi:WD40 repeat protein